jgi:putative toxin-antitoxin system antitoxin component (TIGR02293 family)
MKGIQANGRLTITQMNHQQSIKRILQRAKEVFSDPEKAREWMNTPNLALGDKPVSLLVSEEGERAVLWILEIIESGGVV